MTIALDQLQLARTNTDLASQLEKVEQDRFALGASDLLALQLREQGAFQARIDEIESLNQYFRAVSDFVVASGISFSAMEEAPVEIQRLTQLLGLPAPPAPP